MFHRMSVFVVFAALLGVGTVATAGSYWGYPSEVFDAGDVIVGQGSLRETRDSNDTRREIGCVLDSWMGGLSAFCYAIDGEGDYASCYTTNPDEVRLLTGINEASEILFYSDVETGYCTFLRVHHGSSQLPGAS